MKVILIILLVLAILLILFSGMNNKTIKDFKPIFIMVLVAFIGLQITLIVFYAFDTHIYNKSVAEIDALIENYESEIDQYEQEIKDIEEKNDIAQTYESTDVQKELIQKNEEKIENLVVERMYRSILDELELEEY